MMSKSLVYLVMARRNPGVSRKNDQMGVVYRHTWETGFQDLVFQNHGKAKEFAEKNSLPYDGPEKK
jgi:hypothetical protein